MSNSRFEDFALQRFYFFVNLLAPPPDALPPCVEMSDGLDVRVVLPLEPYQLIAELVYLCNHFFLIHSQNNVGSSS